VYEYLVGRNSDREKLVFDGFKTLERQWQHWNPKGCRPTGTTAIFRVSRQVHDEALAILYEQNTFFVRIRNYHTILMTIPYRQWIRSENYGAAMPYGWDVSRILHLCVGVELIPASAETPQLLANIKWTALPRMKSLRKLRFFMANYPTVISQRNSPPVYNRDLDGDGKLRTGTVCYRQFMRKAIAHIRNNVEVSLGLDTRDEQLMFYEMSGRMIYTSCGKYSGPLRFVPGTFLEQTFEEFKGLRGVDVECYIED
jgi:hypothetical protein